MTKVIDSKNIQVVGDKVAVVRKDASHISEGGIHLAVELKPTEGKVWLVGPGKLRKNGTRIPPPLKPGDRVFFWMHGAGHDYMEIIEGGEVLFMDYEHIYAVVEGDPDSDSE